MKKATISLFLAVFLVFPSVSMAQVATPPQTQEEIQAQLRDLMNQLILIVQQLTDQLNAKLAEQGATLAQQSTDIQAIKANTAPKLGATPSPTPTPPPVVVSNEPQLDTLYGVIRKGSINLPTVNGQDGSKMCPDSSCAFSVIFGVDAGRDDLLATKSNAKIELTDQNGNSVNVKFTVASNDSTSKDTANLHYISAGNHDSWFFSTGGHQFQAGTYHYKVTSLGITADPKAQSSDDPGIPVMDFTLPLEGTFTVSN